MASFEGFGGFTEGGFDFTSSPAPPRTAPRRTLTLEDILRDHFLPEFQRLQGGRAASERDLRQRIASGPDYSGLRGELTTVATGITDELFAPGGQVDQATRTAFGDTVASGFGPTSGSYERARQHILGGARDAVSRGIAQGALQLAPTAMQARAGDIASLIDVHGLETGRLEGLRESLFGGQATIENLRLADETLGLNRSIVDAYLRQAGRGRGIGSRIGGAASGALAGAQVGAQLGTPFGLPGMGVGAAVGGLAGLLF
jgi:hypothetical protein